MSAYVTASGASTGSSGRCRWRTARPRACTSAWSRPAGWTPPSTSRPRNYLGRAGDRRPRSTTREGGRAAALVAALDRDRRDRDVGFANKLMVFGFRGCRGVFDVLVGPMMRVLGQGRAAVEPHPGNVLEPRPGGQAVRGRWPHPWG